MASYTIIAFAHHQDKSSGKCLILGDSSYRVSKGHLLTRADKKVAVTKKASSAYLLLLIEPLPLLVKRRKIPKDRSIRVEVARR